MANTANLAQPQTFINYISQRKKIIVNDHNQPSQLLIQTDYYLNDTLYFKVINVNNQIVELDSNTTYQLYGTYIDAKKQVHILFYTLGVTPRDNTLEFLVNTYTSQYLAYVKSNRTPIEISIVAKQTVGSGTKSYMVLRDSALANPRGYIEGQAPTDIVYQNVFNANVPVTGSFGAGTNLDLAQDLEGQDVGSFAFGDTLTTSNANQFVIGYNNTPDATKAFIVANSGNIFTVDYEGNVEAGDLNVGAISATSITVSGEDFNQVIDDKVEYLSTAFDDKLSTTENWVNETFQPISTALENYNELTASINDLSTATDEKFTVTSGWVNSTFETSANAAAAYNALEQDISDLSTAADGKFELKTDATEKFETLTGQTNYLSGQIDATNLVVNQVTNTLASKADKSALDELSGQVQAIPVVTKVSDLEQDIPYLSAITSADMPTGYATEQWVLDKHYITSAEAPSTVYTAGFGLKLEEGEFSLTGTVLSGSDHITIENNQIKLVGDVGKTYTGASGIIVDDTIIGISATIPTTVAELSDASDYALKTDVPSNSDISGIASAVTTGIVTKEYVNALGIDGTTYTAGDGLGLDQTEGKHEFYLTAQIPTVETLSAEMIEATSATIRTGLATTDDIPTTVEELTDSSNYALKTDIPSDYTTSAQVSSIVENYGYQTAAQVSAIASGYAGTDVDYTTVFNMLSSGDTDTLVISKDDQNEKIVFTAAGGGGGGGTQLYHGTAIGGIDVNNVDYTISISANYLSANALEGYAEQSWVEEHFLSSIPDTYALKTDIPTDAEITGLAKDYVDSLNISTTYATKNELSSKANTADLTAYQLKSQVVTYTAGNGLKLQNNEFSLTATIPSIEGLATVEQVSTASSTLTAQTNYLSGVIDNLPAPTAYTAGSGLELVGTEFKLTAEIPSIEGLATEQYVQQQVSGKADKSDLEYVSGIVDTKANSSALSDYALESDLQIVSAAISESTISAVSQLANDSQFITLASIPEIPSIEGLASESYVTGKINDLSAVISTDYALKSEIPTVPTNVGDFTNNVGYLTAVPSEYITQSELSAEGFLKEVPDTYATKQWVEDKNYLTGVDLSNYATTGYVTGYCSAFITAEDIPAQTEYTAGEGLKLQNNEFSLTAAIPSVEGLVSASQVSGIVKDMSAAIVDGYATESFVTSQGYITGIEGNALLSDVTSAIEGISATISSDYALKTDLPVELSGSDTITISDNEISLTDASNYVKAGDNVSRLTNDADYISSIALWFDGESDAQNVTDIFFTSDFTWNSGDLGINAQGIIAANEIATESYVDAAIPVLSSSISSYLSAGDNINLSVDANGVVTISGTAGGGGTVNVDTICGMLSSANDNLTIAKQDNLILFTATGGGGGGSILTGVSELTNDVGFITNEDLTNKQRVSDPTPAVTIIDYNPAYEIFKTTYTVSDGAIELSAVTDTSGLLTNGDVATFEEWITTASDCTATVATGINLIGEIPDLTSGNYHVFVRRLVKTGNTVTQYVSFAYEAPIPTV